MAITIAVAGKGGTGKTTFCGMLIDWMGKNGKGPILAVDADANSNLNEVLGVDVETTLGDVRELVAGADLALESPIPVGMSKQDFMEHKLQGCLIEDDDFDLIVMGRTQGKGCYCFVNDLLQRELIKLEKNYPYMVVDNEAGMEHISRGVLPSVDYIVLVSDCSRRGVQAVARIAQLVNEVGMNPKKLCLVINRAPGGVLNDGTAEEIQKHNLNLIGVIPQDEQVFEYDCDGKATSTLPQDSAAKKAVAEIAKKLFN